MMKKIFFTILTLSLYVAGVMAQSACPDTLRASASITIAKHNPLPAHMLEGKFSVSTTKQVRFSDGNLQYLADENRWRFAPEQYEWIGNAVGNITAPSQRENNVGWIDNFAWATSGNSEAGTYYEPWRLASTSSSEASKFGSSVTSGDWDPTKCDWGVVNMGAASGWRVLTKDEWTYLANRTNEDGTRLVMRTSINHPVLGNKIVGYLLLPDGWRYVNSAVAGPAETNETVQTWKNFQTLLKEGAVFLPSTSYVYYNNSTEVRYQSPSTNAYYWTATASDATNAYVWTGSTYCTTQSRSYGISVRLVHDVE